ncbi:hypothetical protein YC2023_030799 [Brassica napus]
MEFTTFHGSHQTFFSHSSRGVLYKCINENICGAFQAIVFDFQPVNPESIEAAISILSRKSIRGVVMQRKLKNVPKQRCWMVGSSKGNNAMEMAIEFNSSWVTGLRVGFHDCRHYTNVLKRITTPNDKYTNQYNQQETQNVNLLTSCCFQTPKIYTIYETRSARPTGGILVNLIFTKCSS